MTKIDEVAQAICGENSTSDWRIYRPEARRAIEAMREPTEAMYAVNYDNGEGALIWRTMIDAALTEPEAPSPR